MIDGNKEVAVLLFVLEHFVILQCDINLLLNVD